LIGMLAIAVNLLGTGLVPSYPVLLVVGLPLAIAGVHFAGQAQKRAMGWIIGSLSIAPILGAPILTTIGGIGYAAGSVAAGGRLHLGSPRTTVAITCAIGAQTVALILLLATPWVVVVLLVVASVASAVAGIGIATLLAAESPAGAGTTMVLNGSLLKLGAATGTALGGGLIAAALAWWPTPRK